jgi:AraC-like DNA-binding protein
MLDTSRHDRPTSTLAARASASDLVPFVVANAWIRAAAHCRINIDPLFKAAGVVLNANNIAMIPKRSMLSLMKQCAEQAAPNTHFPLVLGEMFAFDYLPAMETFLATSPTLRHTLPALQWAGLTMPNLSMRVEENGPLTATIIDIDTPPDTDPQVRGYFVEAVLASFAKTVKMALGEARLIQRVEMRHRPNARFLAATTNFPAPILGGQARDAAVYATRLLDMPLPGASPGLHQRAQELVQQQLPSSDDNIVIILERTFRQSPALLGQGLERIAERLSMHPRTLQRRLKEEGQQFTDIQSRTRLEIARVALSARQCDMEALSAELGFADRHSFTRAFKRWTGLSPSAYKRQQQAGVSTTLKP